MRFSLKNKSLTTQDAVDTVPQIAFAPASSTILSDDECFALWHKYSMLPNVQSHSKLVAHVATRIASDLFAAGFATDCATIRASALLHDLAKTYCLQHGGGHAQLGAAWVVAETRNYAVAQGVFLHVMWPWAIPAGKDLATSLPLLVLYADKRVRHDSCVTLAERFDDLLQRYGSCDAARESIKASLEQSRKIERKLSLILGRDLNEDSFDSWRLV